MLAPWCIIIHTHSHTHSDSMKISNPSGLELLQNLLRTTEPERLTTKNILALRDQVSRFLFMSDTPGPVDLCIVLGSPTFTNVDPAIFLYKSGLTKHILVTGFGPKLTGIAESFIPEYAGLKQRALDAGVSRDAILVEKSATNTLENFVNSSEIIESHFGWQKVSNIAVAGKPLHMRRAFLTACKNWPAHIKLLMQPTISSADLQSHNWWQSKNAQERVLSELKSIIKYSTRGDIQSV